MIHGIELMFFLFLLAFYDWKLIEIFFALRVYLIPKFNKVIEHQQILSC